MAQSAKRIATYIDREAEGVRSKATNKKRKAHGAEREAKAPPVLTTTFEEQACGP